MFGDGTLADSVFFFKQKTAYEMRISDWSSDVCSSDLYEIPVVRVFAAPLSCTTYELYVRLGARCLLTSLSVVPQAIPITMSLSKNDASRRPAKVATFSRRSSSPTSSGTVTPWARTPYIGRASCRASEGK